MIGHPVTGTAWKVVVTYRGNIETVNGNPVKESEAPMLQFHRCILTATDDGSEVFEVARRQFFSDEATATRFGFAMLHAEKLYRVDGMALSSEVKALS